MAKSSAHTS